MGINYHGRPHKKRKINSTLNNQMSLFHHNAYCFVSGDKAINFFFLFFCFFIIPFRPNFDHDMKALSFGGFSCWCFVPHHLRFSVYRNPNLSHANPFLIRQLYTLVLGQLESQNKKITTVCMCE
jgi:hypothetical protein